MILQESWSPDFFQFSTESEHPPVDGKIMVNPFLVDSLKFDLVSDSIFFKESFWSLIQPIFFYYYQKLLILFGHLFSYIFLISSAYPSCFNLDPAVVPIFINLVGVIVLYMYVYMPMCYYVSMYSMHAFACKCELVTWMVKKIRACLVEDNTELLAGIEEGTHKDPLQKLWFSFF